ncbi:MAG: ATP-binding protein [Succinatimonas sp.]|nr:ATP-binding protein [Succinatimonas sp.]
MKTKTTKANVFEPQFNTPAEKHHTLEEVLELFTQLRLGTAKAALLSRVDEPYFNQLVLFDQLFCIFNPEVIKRKDSSFNNNVKKANLRSNATPSQINEAKERYNLESNQLEYLFSDRWLKSHKRIVIQGRCGAGKTSLATAILVSLMKLGYKTRSEDFATLMFKLSVAKDSDSSTSTYYYDQIKQIASNKVLLLDDFVIEEHQEAYAPILKNLLDECADSGCELIITAQKTKSKWIEALGSNELAEACVDRIRQNDLVIKLTGDSFRAIKQGDEGDELFKQKKEAVTNDK